MVISIGLYQHGLIGEERMRLLLVIMILLAGEAPAPVTAGEQRLDRSKEFAYTLPDEWKVVLVPNVTHDVLLLPTDDGKNRNIVINDQPGTNSLAELKQKYERDLPSSELVEFKDKRQAIRIIHTNTTPGVPVRQINYVLEAGGKRYFVACTVLKEDGDKYDQAFEDFASSIAEPDK
jgi:hypothetical protein